MAVQRRPIHQITAVSEDSERYRITPRPLGLTSVADPRRLYFSVLKEFRSARLSVLGSTRGLCMGMRQRSRLSNWGRWGTQDERGAANLLTDERVAETLAQPRVGRVFTLGTQVGRYGPVSGGRNPTWHVTTQAQNPHDPGRGRAEDLLIMHTHAHSHVDGLSHVWVDGQLYNGFPASAVSRAGTRHASIENLGALVGEAVLLDVSTQRSWSAGDAIRADDLARAADAAGGTVSRADIALVRTGWMELHGESPRRFAEGEPGLAPDAAEWLAELDLAAVGMDNFGIEPIPPSDGANPLYCHELFLRDLGVYLIENLTLAEAAASEVTSGLFVAAPLKVDRGLGGPVNPVLIA